MSKISKLSANSQIIYEKAKAGYPAIYFVTREDMVALKEIQEASVALERKLYLWRFGTGVEELGDKKNQVVADTGSPTEVLSKITAIAGKGAKGGGTKAIVVLRDFHDFLEDPMVRSLLKDVIPEFKLSNRMLIITAPMPKIPPELEKEVALLEGGLPDKNQIAALIDGIVSGGNLPPDMIPNAERRKDLVEAAMGLTANEAENALSLSLIRPRTREDKNIWNPAIVMDEKCGSLRKSNLLDYVHVSDEGLKQIGGLDLLKEWVRKRKNAFTDKAKTFGLPAPKGILTVGPPGSGKSLSAKAIAGELKMPLLRLDMGKMFGSLVGQSEQNMREAIMVAEAMSPAILWVDEIEKGLAGSGAGALDSGVGARVLGNILTWMSEKTAPVFVYATANDVTSLPPELLRKGRFDEMFSVSFPNEIERAEIFAIHLTRIGRLALLTGGKIDVDKLVEESEGYSGAEIEACIIEGLFSAFHENRELEEKDIVGALEATTPLSQTAAEKMAALAKWCEHRTRPANRQTEKAAVGRSVEAN